MLLGILPLPAGTQNPIRLRTILIDKIPSKSGELIVTARRHRLIVFPGVVQAAGHPRVPIEHMLPSPLQMLKINAGRGHMIILGPGIRKGNKSLKGNAVFAVGTLIVDAKIPTVPLFGRIGKMLLVMKADICALAFGRIFQNTCQIRRSNIA